MKVLICITIHPDGATEIDAHGLDRDALLAALKVAIDKVDRATFCEKCGAHHVPDEHV